MFSTNKEPQAVLDIVKDIRKKAENTGLDTTGNSVFQKPVVNTSIKKLNESQIELYTKAISEFSFIGTRLKNAVEETKDIEIIKLYKKVSDARNIVYKALKKKEQQLK